MKLDETSVFEMQVQFEDLDMGGVVHHPNYLKYYERARSAAMASTPFPYSKMWEMGLAMAVAEAYLAYRKPLRIYQDIFVCSRITGVLKANFKIAQAICGSRPSAEALKQAGADLSKLPDVYHHASLRIVCIDLKAMKTAPPPLELFRAFGVASAEDVPEGLKQVRILN